MLSHFYNAPPAGLSKEEDDVLIQLALEILVTLGRDVDHTERILQHAWGFVQARRIPAKTMLSQPLPAAIAKEDDDTLFQLAFAVYDNLPRNPDLAERILQHTRGFNQARRAIAKTHEGTKVVPMSDNVIPLKSA